jgi:hypothetical protein
MTLAQRAKSNAARSRKPPRAGTTVRCRRFIAAKSRVHSSGPQFDEGRSCPISSRNAR